MWTSKNRPKYNRDKLRYPSDLTDDEWSHIEPLIPPAKRGGRKSEVQADKHSDGRIGKDDVRILSKQNFERRIEELKHDSGAAQQEPLIKGIYVIREFCLDKKSNVFLVSERTLQQKDEFRGLIYRLLDYRIIHSGATALSHKSHEGAYQAFAIDIGCYAHLRKRQGKFNEVDLSVTDAKEKLRSAPLMELGVFEDRFSKAPDDTEAKLIAEEPEA